MKEMKKKILYSTQGFPGDLYSEKVFLETELRELRKYFDEIVLLPCDPAGQERGYEHQLPDGITVDWSLVHDGIFHNKVRKFILYILHPDVLRMVYMIIGEVRTPAQFIKGIFQAINIVRIGTIARRVLKNHDMSSENTVLMSMWFHDPASALARLARIEGYGMVTHAHTSDIYDERMIFRSHRLRRRLLESIKFVLTISRDGRDYLTKRFPEHKEKFIFAPLGSKKLFKDGMSKTDKNRNDIISFVTVARLDAIKRIDMIMATLGCLAKLLPEYRISYSVIGDGPQQEALKMKADELGKISNLKIEFVGMLANEEIQRRFMTVSPDWMIMMSESEGIPISMGEAMSYGIPIITTDVGQIRELVDEECGVILNRHASPKQAAEIMCNVVTDRAMRNTMGQAAFRKWESTFDSEKNAAETARRVASLLK